MRLDTSRAWHLDRARMWRTLCERGLRRCLFGVESGVTSILQRFNKETTGDQNALAIRTDLLLRPVPHLGIKDIVDGVRDESFIAAHATGKPFYTGISYMLVSMECLIGAAYTKQVHAAGLPQTS